MPFDDAPHHVPDLVPQEPDTLDGERQRHPVPDEPMRLLTHIDAQHSSFETVGIGSFVSEIVKIAEAKHPGTQVHDLLGVKPLLEIPRLVQESAFVKTPQVVEHTISVSSDASIDCVLTLDQVTHVEAIVNGFGTIHVDGLLLPFQVVVDCLLDNRWRVLVLQSYFIDYVV
jgi:hypothetical protein